MNKNEILDVIKELEAPEVDECLSLVLCALKEQTETINVSLLQANGMILASEVVSDMNVPPFPKSAMDGYAVKASDLEGVSAENPAVFKVVGELLAGDYKEFTYEKNTAVRVMTGAYVPEGYDSVIKQEDTDYGEENVTIFTSSKQYNNYCHVGEDIKQGQVVIQKNTKINSLSLGLLASIGVKTVDVYKPVKVAIISTGSELMTLGNPLEKGKIYNSISYMLAGAIQKEGMLVSSIETCQDEEELLKEMISDAVCNSDIVVTTGAVSVGKKDIVPKVLEELGADILFRRANIQPGTPTTASVLNDKVILSLSGNPFAALANFELYFWPMLAKMMHCDDFLPVIEEAQLQMEYDKVNRLRRLIRAKVEDGKVYLPTSVHASSVINNLLECNCFIDLESNRKVSVGDTVKVRYFKV